jgi:EAL domain-containing protein (putative c-di-GMP-specific phosphodiesterase class I)
MWEMFRQEWQTELANFPFLLLQGAAVVGILSMVLMMTRDRDHLIGSRKLHYGAVLGASGYLLTAFVAEFIQAPSKPYVRNDFLFLAGLLGGVQGGAVCFVLLSIARLQFGGVSHIVAGLLDMAVVTAGGIAMHAWIKHRKLADLGLKDVMWVLLMRVAISIVAVLLMGCLNLAEKNVIQSIAMRRLSSGVIISFFIIVAIFALLRREASDRAARAYQLELTTLDPLTGMKNRRALRNYLDVLLEQKRDQSHTVILIELANPVEMLLVHGDDWGGHFWRNLERMLQQGHLGDLLAPYESRFFQFADLTMAVLLHRVTLAKIENSRLVWQMHADISQQLLLSSSGPAPQICYGIADIHDGSKIDAATALRNLNLAMQSGEPTVRYFHQSFAEKAELDEQVRQLLMRWIAEGRAPLQYQPKYNIVSNRIVSAEALLRAKDRNGNALSPGYVLEIAARHRLVAAFEWATIESVVQDASQCFALGSPLQLAVNLSAASLGESDLEERISALLRDRRVPSHFFSIEITETSPVPDSDTVRENLQKLNASGVYLALDDFGTGYSGLSMLARFPFNEVKIDYSIISRLDLPRMQSAVSLSLETAQRYHAVLVAEGVETHQQVEILKQLGVEFGQGYLYSAAIPIQQLTRVIEKIAIER